VKKLSKEDQQSYLRDPQLQNSYSYARDNPIALKDQNGKLVQTALLLARNALIGGATADLGLYASNVPLNLNQGKTGSQVFTNNFSTSDYAEAFGKGAVVGAINPSGVFTTGALVGAVDLVNDFRSGRTPDLKGASIDALTGMAGTKALQQFAQVRGVQPSTIGGPLAIGAHTQRAVQENLFQTQLTYLQQTLTALYASLASLQQATPQNSFPENNIKSNN